MSRSKWSRRRSVAFEVRPFCWRLMPYYEQCVVDSTVRWLCFSLTWENP